MKKPTLLFTAALAGLTLLQSPIQAQAAPKVSVIRISPNSGCQSGNTNITDCLPDEAKDLLESIGISPECLQSGNRADTDTNVDASQSCKPSTNTDASQSCKPNTNVSVYGLPNLQIQIPSTCRPSAKTPEVSKPDVTAPEISKPETQAPEFSKPEAQAPEISRPETQTPESSKPETSKPETQAPEISRPETQTPESSKPETSRPETQAPEISRPETQTPEISKPETSRPETQAPESSRPETQTPESSKPETQTPESAETGYHTYVLRIVELVNEARAAAGLKPVTLRADVTAVAQLRAKEIVTSFSHTRPNGSSCFTALSESGVSYRGAGENIAYGQKSPEEVMNGWMNSAGHRANILNAGYTSIGVGYYQKNGVNYWSQMFTY